MNKKIIKSYIPFSIFFLIFSFLLIGVLFIDVKINPVNDTNIGFSKLNFWFLNLLGGYNSLFYLLSKVLTVVLILGTGVFFVLELIKVLKNKSLKVIEKDVWAMILIFVLLGITYLLFEIVTVNYRPIIMKGEGAEKSFPSSHTLLSITLTGVFVIYFIKNIKNSNLQFFLILFTVLVGLLMVIFRTLSSVHWITDIMAGFFLGLAYTFLYYALTKTGSKDNS